MDKYYLIFPLIAGLFYAVAALFVKAGAREGVGPVRTTLLLQWCMAAAFLSFYPWSEFPVLPAIWWPSILVGLFFFIGQVFLVLSYARGDVSVATPVMATRVLFIALILSLIARHPLSPSTWLAAILSTVAIFLLAGPFGGRVFRGRRARNGVVFALVSAIGFAGLDVMVQLWSPVVGFGLLLPFAMLFSALIGTVVLLNLAKSRSFRFSGRAWSFLIPGVGLLTLQAILMIWTVGTFGDAPGANVAYGSRGVWSVLVVWVFGALLGDRESLQDRNVVIRRLVGAGLMVVGIVLVFQ